MRAACIALALLASCALFPGDRVWPRHDAISLGSARFLIEYEDADEPAAREVEVVLADSATRLRRWGEFAAPVEIRLQPSHQELEEAALRSDYPWLRAWARYGTIDLQSPRTWGPNGANPRQLGELLTHELTHCLVYQRVGSAADWADRDLPLWFREGIASVTAEQGYRRTTLPQLADYLRAHPKTDLLAQADELYRTEPEIVYGAAHRAFEFLLARWGDDGVEAIFGAMRSGARFSGAMRVATGLGESEFASEFDRYVREPPEAQEP